eukprot:3377875-Rhodomonas_salina.1
MPAHRRERAISVSRHTPKSNTRNRNFGTICTSSVVLGFDFALYGLSGCEFSEMLKLCVCRRTAVREQSLPVNLSVPLEPETEHRTARDKLEACDLVRDPQFPSTASGRAPETLQAPPRSACALARRPPLYAARPKMYAARPPIYRGAPATRPTYPPPRPPVPPPPRPRPGPWPTRNWRERAAGWQEVGPGRMVGEVSTGHLVGEA